MDILKFEILDENDEIVKVDNQQVHVKKKNGEYVVYTIHLDKDEQFVSFNVFAITKGNGSIELIKDADLDDLAQLWENNND